MSALLTHIAGGLLVAIVGVLLAGAVPARRAFLILATVTALAIAPDLDLWIGVHRVTFHNVWALLFLPAVGASLLHATRWATSWLGNVAHVAPAALGAELWLDLFAPDLSGYTEVFWPVRAGGYLRPDHPVYYVGDRPMYDMGSLLLLLFVYYILLAVVHQAAVRRLATSEGTAATVERLALHLPGLWLMRAHLRWVKEGEGGRPAVALLAPIHAGLALAPIPLLLWTGQLVRVSL
ncbi:MAG: hypothetical protein ACPGQL_01370 [Thermoplasmatota archaeon]